MQEKLKEHFGDKIIQADINGKPNVVTFLNKANAVLYDYYSHQDFDPETQKLRIIEVAATLIKDDIKAVKTPHSVYPACEEQGSEDALLQHIPWTRGATYHGLCTVYTVCGKEVWGSSCHFLWLW